MNFGALPPEVNSARMYAGPGAGSMLAAAGAWDALAAELHSTAASYGSVISGLASSSWQGASSASMAAAAAPYMAWMSATAAQAEQVANQARAAASAYSAAFAMTVPPPLIAANRSQLMTLVATNFLGINTPAIMATEAHYGEMWAQDAAAMYGYAGESAAASTLAPFTPPAHTTNPGGLAGQAAAVAHATGMSAGTHAHAVASHLSSSLTTVPHTLQGLAQPMPPPSSSSSGLSSTVLGTGTSAAASGTSTPASMLMGMGTSGGKGALKTAGNSAGMGGALSGLTGAAGGAGGENSIGLIEDTAGLGMDVVGFGAMDGGGLGLDLIGVGMDFLGADEVGEVAGELVPAGGLGGLGLVPAGGLGHLAPLGGLGGAGAAASVGQAASVGAMSVPQSWASIPPAAAMSSAMPAPPVSPSGATALPGTNLGAVPPIRPAAELPAATVGAAVKLEAGSSGKLFSEGLLASMAGRAIGGAASIGRRERIGATNRGQAVPPQQSQDGPSTLLGIAGELRELAELRDSGILTDEEFNEQKRRLLGRRRSED
jgi:PPE-repeat protein